MKIRLLGVLVGLAISFAVPTFAQEQNAVDPEVRQQIEDAYKKFDEAYSKHDAAATAALFTQDAAEVLENMPEGGLASGQQAIKKRLEVDLASSPQLSQKLVQLYAIGNDVCAITEYRGVIHKGYAVTIWIREGDEWKIRVSYVN
jgi:ketosteroid isomerase-like protein